jgi:hypothetical protein
MRVEGDGTCVFWDEDEDVIMHLVNMLWSTEYESKEKAPVNIHLETPQSFMSLPALLLPSSHTHSHCFLFSA